MRIAMIGQKGIGIGERGGGIEQHVAALAKFLAARGHDVTVYGRPAYGCKNEVRKTEGGTIRVRCLPTVYRKNFEAIVHTFLCTVDALFQRYDIIHYHGVGPATLAWIPRVFQPRARVVATFHAQDRFHQKWGIIARSYLWLGEWAACWFPHATIAVSHVIQVFARQSLHRQIVYIPNGATVESDARVDALSSFGLAPGKYVLNVSRLVPHKGQRYLIEAYQALASEGVDLPKLVFVGAESYTSGYEDELKRAAAGNPDILFLGYQTGEALRQLFAHAFLYVQPSESEGLPVVVLEAMSYGTSVLVSDIPENLEAIKRAGFWFRNKDTASLADKLRELIQHPDVVHASSKQVQDVIREYFSWPVIAEHVEEVYRSVRH
jgi:glycosyltransferase involved in cell wall biosynthesis